MVAWAICRVQPGLPQPLGTDVVVEQEFVPAAQLPLFEPQMP
jgi:hypothetical protein